MPFKQSTRSERKALCVAGDFDEPTCDEQSESKGNYANNNASLAMLSETLPLSVSRFLSRQSPENMYSYPALLEQLDPSTAASKTNLSLRTERC